MDWPEFRAIERAPADERHAWGAHEDAHGDWYLPAGEGPHPVVVLVHGGCWQTLADLGYVGHLAREVSAWGWAVWVPEFRRADAEADAWPTIFEDVAAATDHLPSSSLACVLSLRGSS